MSLSPLKNDSCSGEHGEGIALAFFLSDDGDDVVAETEVIFGQEKSMSITCAGSCYKCRKKLQLLTVNLLCIAS